jgi:hypothetical protein
MVASSLTALALPVQAATLSLTTAADYEGAYNRSAFRHWIDADKDGCDTRAEVLIEEALVKPKVGKKCALTGGKWRSQYDKLVTTNASALDIDHLVPLAEAWRSGAWAWTDKQREDFANDLTDSRALVAVSASSNRSKGDKDYSQWQPKLSDGTEPWIGCNYLNAWIAIKMRYQLTVDSNEASWINTGNTTCAFGDSISVKRLDSFKANPGTVVAPSKKPNIAPGDNIGIMPDFVNNYFPYVKEVKLWKNNLNRHLSSLDFLVEDPPIGFLTEDLNDNCVVTATAPSRGEAIYQNVPIEVTVRCRWVKAESVAGAGWKWRQGKSTTPIEATSCAKLIEVEIDGIKALACAPPENAPKASASPAPTSSGSKQCWVNGYTTKKGTTVKGYYRSC